MQTKEAQELANELGAAHVETSAKENVNVGMSHLFAWRSSRALTPPETHTTHISFVAKVFELCLAEIEKRQPSNKAEPKASSCNIM